MGKDTFTNGPENIFDVEYHLQGASDYASRFRANYAEEVKADVDVQPFEVSGLASNALSRKKAYEY